MTPNHQQIGEAAANLNAARAEIHRLRKTIVADVDNFHWLVAKMREAVSPYRSPGGASLDDFEVLWNEDEIRYHGPKGIEVSLKAFDKIVRNIDAYQAAVKKLQSHEKNFDRHDLEFID